jgi:hypothetical protein
MVRKPERYPGAAAPDSRHNTWHKERIDVDYDLAVRLKRSARDTILNRLIQARECLPSGHRDTVHQSDTRTGAGRTKKSNQMAHAPQGIANVLRDTI